MNERSGDRGVDAPAQAKDDAFVADRIAYLADRLFDIVGHRPLRLALANLQEEVGEHFHSQLGVCHLRVELHPIKFTFGILDRGIG